MDIYENKENNFDFEKYICYEKPEIWRNEAYNLFSSAQVLLEFSNQKMKEIFSNSNKLLELFSFDIVKKGNWHYRIIRMLWGYGFENILKGIIIINYKKNHPDVKEVPINEIKSHNLKSLFKRAGFNLDEKFDFYIGVIEKCSVWSGRYPLPIDSKQMYELRKPMRSSEELNKRSIELHEKFLKGEIPRTFCESDVLHGGVSVEEYDIIKELINKTFETFEILNNTQNQEQ